MPLDKTIQLVEYLTKLARLNTKIVRTLEDYEKILWVHELPNDPGFCFTQAWGIENEHAGDVWIEVKKRTEPKFPQVPIELAPWVKQETLKNTNDFPELHDHIVIERIEEDSETGEEFTTSETIYIQDCPDIQQAWDDYLEGKWEPWLERYKRYEAVQSVYAKLFHIYHEQLKRGEQYELVLCKGLLSWRTPDGHEAKRHLIVAKATLEFESALGQFFVKQSTDGDLIDIELDMLDSQHQPPNVRQLIENGRNDIGSDLWDRSGIDTVLDSIANSLADSGQGEYHPDIIKPEQRPVTEKPVVEIAPALILRKRSTHGLEQFIASMKTQIEAGGIVPAAFGDLSESLDPADDRHDTAATEGRVTDEEIYFPLPANDEQRKIIRILDRQKGVLVQGPPGTGKSHTIVNLICHLLATGKRVLVTAKTPRALQVLHEKLDEYAPAITPLCINLLGQGAEEKASVDKSVSGLLAGYIRRDQTENEQQIQVLKNQIDANRRDKAETDNKIMALREEETYEHNLANGQYSGTAAKIARKLHQKDKLYEWFTDTPTVNDPLPLSQEDINYLCQNIIETNQTTEQELRLLLPDIKALPEARKVRNAFLKEKEYRQKSTAGQARLDSQQGQALHQAGKDKIIPLRQRLKDFSATCATIRQRPMPWIEKAVNDVLTDNDTPWKELLKLSKQNVSGLHEVAVKVDRFDISIPKDMDRKKVLHDAKALKEHFDEGKGLGFWIFKPKAVKIHGGLIAEVRVDGLECKDSDTLTKLIDYLTVEQKLKYVWSIWRGKADRNDGPFPLQFADIEELHEALESIISLYNQREEVRLELDQIHGLPAPCWEDNQSVNVLIGDCEIALAHIEYTEIRKILTQRQHLLSDHAARNKAHPINEQISKAFQERDEDSYCQLIEETETLHQMAKKIKTKQLLIDKLVEAAPDLAGHLARCNDKEKGVWVNRLNQLPHAWAWAQASKWLEDFLASDIDALERHSKELDGRIKENIADLASAQAWEACCTRMEESHRRHLVSWQQCRNRVTQGGAGVNDPINRRNAQKHFNEAKDAIPAWIMPLHRVYETVKANAGSFDVIIVDEASQCGPESLPLMYLGKKILIVGDDKQISPEAVGIQQGPVQQLIQNYLSDFEHAASFDPTNSLFAHGEIRFSDRISLREHFRCMPEIIRFSNDLCYGTNPLIPLRQYPPDRLEPLKSVHVQDGYREGANARVINHPEADAIVAAIEKCCKDDRYEGMTMGVIALQGSAQAYLIEEKLLQTVGAEEMEERRLICGNPYSFQGDERDVIFLSLVAAPNAQIGAMVRPPDKRRFNVAASRAKEQMWLFHSVTTNNLSARCYRKRLLQYFLNPPPPPLPGVDVEELREIANRADRMIERPPKPFDSWFEVDVALEIVNRGFRVVPQFEFAGKRIDLVIQDEKSQREKSQLAVECDGDFWHGRDAYDKDMERQRQLERCGWSFFRIRESRFYADPEKALDPLWELLDRMGIFSAFANDEQEAEAEDDNGYEENDEPEEEVDTDTEPTERERPSTGNVTQLSLFEEQEDADVPENIQQALTVKPGVINKAIIRVLEKRPKNSCIKEKLPRFILQSWSIVTRGNPFNQFATRVNRQVAIMNRKGYVVIYKSKNERVKLGHVEYPK